METIGLIVLLLVAMYGMLYWLPKNQIRIVMKISGVNPTPRDVKEQKKRELERQVEDRQTLIEIIDREMKD